MNRVTTSRMFTAMCHNRRRRIAASVAFSFTGLRCSSQPL
ncbi:hypothetical protein RLIN73S_04636 [Rhodanobacter lindaniclasticus]